MSDLAIKVEHLSKQYRIGEQERYKALRDVITESVTSPFRRLRSKIGSNGNGSVIRNPESETRNSIWALDDVSFEVKQGEVVGIIGRNGAGKSTLLKILSRITKPTKGHAKIYGRVGSLLEVGTGFHPELTGRENIYLNGAILGMRKAEIERKFDEIVAFAEVEKFIDTPVKRYSSGMYVRLAFAVAAHMETEVLLVDEVLAVGDAQFQKKCLGKISEVSQAGRTVVFVSHQLNQLRRLCTSAIWLNDGRVAEVGGTVAVVSSYEMAASLPIHERPRYQDRNCEFLTWELAAEDCLTAHTLTTSGPVKVRFTVRISEPIHHGHHGVILYNANNQIMWSTGIDNLKLDAGLHHFEYDFPLLPLMAGNYHWLVSLYEDGNQLDEWGCVPEMIVVSQHRTHSLDHLQGVLSLPWDFHVN